MNKNRIGMTDSLDTSVIDVPIKNNMMRKIKNYEIPYYLNKNGLSAFEIYSDNLKKKNTSEKYFLKMKEYSKKYDVSLSLHSPYYISPTNTKKESVKSSSLISFMEMYFLCEKIGATRFVLHPGGYNTLDSCNAIKVSSNFIIRGIESFIKKYPQKKELINNISCCVETMGKTGQLGSLLEIIEIIKEVNKPSVIPCIDFGHEYARNFGNINYKGSLDLIENELGSKIVENLHIHLSKIEYGKKGEIKHLYNCNGVYGPDFIPYFKILKEETGYTHTIINETPGAQHDAFIMMEEYKTIFSE